MHSSTEDLSSWFIFCVIKTYCSSFFALGPWNVANERFQWSQDADTNNRTVYGRPTACSLEATGNRHDRQMPAAMGWTGWVSPSLIEQEFYYSWQFVQLCDEEGWRSPCGAHISKAERTLVVCLGQVALGNSCKLPRTIRHSGVYEKHLVISWQSVLMVNIFPGFNIWVWKGFFSPLSQ